jgi:hypothetical protein
MSLYSFENRGRSLLLCLDFKKLSTICQIKNPPGFPVDSCCGERGIRTPGTSQFNGFQDRRDRPLCHLSECRAKVDDFFKPQKSFLQFFPEVLKKKGFQRLVF